MKQQYYTTTTTNNNRIDLLKDWHGGTHCYTIFEKLEAIANNAIIECYKNGRFKFNHGEPPRNGADMFDSMPYTDTSDIAAAKKAAEDAIEAARAAVNDYNAAKVDGFEELRRSF